MTLKPFYIYIHKRTQEREQMKGLKGFILVLNGSQIMRTFLGVILLLYWCPLKVLLHFWKIKRIPNGSNCRLFVGVKGFLCVFSIIVYELLTQQ